MNRNLKVVFGLLLIALGAIGILETYDVVSFSFFSIWTYVLLGLGIIFEVAYFSGERKTGGLLIAGGILIVIGGMFVAASLISWHMMADIWPLIILAPGFGLLQAHVIHKKDRGMLTASLILIGISVMFFNVTLFGLDSYILISIVLILLGAYMVFKPNKKKTDDMS